MVRRLLSRYSAGAYGTMIWISSLSSVSLASEMPLLLIDHTNGHCITTLGQVLPEWTISSTSQDDISLK